MNRTEKGKTALISVGVITLILSVAAIIGGVLLIINAVSGDAISVVGLIFGILLCLLFIFGLIIGIYFTWVGSVLVAKKGSVVEDNLGHDTMNAKLCRVCGVELNNESFCPSCGKSTFSSCSCPKCGFCNYIENKHCANCGEILH